MKNKNIKLWIAILACLAGWSSCTHEEYVDVEYPAQQIYMPAANVGDDGIYLIDDVPSASLSEEVPGNPYRFKVDMKTYDFIVPLAVYRSGIEAGGTLNINLRVNNDTIQKLINARQTGSRDTTGRQIPVGEIGRVGRRKHICTVQPAYRFEVSG